MLSGQSTSRARGLGCPILAWLLLLSAAATGAGGRGGLHAHSSGRTRINPTDGAEMVYVPAGKFLMGDSDQDDNPRHTVTLTAYWIYKTPVTVRQYKTFCERTGHAMPPAPDFNRGWRNEDHPIAAVSWEDALAYATWARVDLPTEAQWEKAARGTRGRQYPWGDKFDPQKLCCSIGLPHGGTAPVGSYKKGASPYGALDMAGNLWQWCSDRYAEDYWKSDHGPDPQGPNDGSTRVLRGGAFDKRRTAVFRTAFRADTKPTSGDANYGFRCAAPAGQTAAR